MDISNLQMCIHPHAWSDNMIVHGLFNGLHQISNSKALIWMHSCAHVGTYKSICTSRMFVDFWYIHIQTLQMRLLQYISV